MAKKKRKRKAYKRSWDTFLTDKRVQWNMYRTYSKWYDKTAKKFGSNMTDKMSYADWVDYMKTAVQNKAVGEKFNVRTEATAHIMTTAKQAKSLVEAVREIQVRAIGKSLGGEQLTGTEALVVRHFGLEEYDEYGVYQGLTSYDVRAKTKKYLDFYADWKKMKDEEGYYDDMGEWQDVNVKDEEIGSP